MNKKLSLLALAILAASFPLSAATIPVNKQTRPLTATQQAVLLRQQQMAKKATATVKATNVQTSGTQYIRQQITGEWPYDLPVNCQSCIQILDAKINPNDPTDIQTSATNASCKCLGKQVNFKNVERCIAKSEQPELAYCNGETICSRSTTCPGPKDINRGTDNRLPFLMK